MAKKETNTKAKKSAQYHELNATEDIVVRVYPKEGAKRISASVTLETTVGDVVIYGQAVNGSNGWFFSWPSYKGKDGEYHNVAYALHKDVNESISEILSELLD